MREEVVSHRGDLARVEASGWKARQRAVRVEVREKSVSYLVCATSEIIR